MARQETCVQSCAADSKAQVAESLPLARGEISPEKHQQAPRNPAAASAERTQAAPGQQKKQQKAVHRAVERLGSVSIIKRGKRFWLSYLEGHRHVRRAVGLRIEEARIAAALIHAQLAEGAPTLFGFARITPSGYMAKWLDYHQHVIGSSVSTIQRYRAAIRHFIDFLVQQGITSLDRITPDIVRHFVKHLRGKLVSSNGHPHTPARPMKDKTIVFCLEVARALLNRAAKDRHLPPYYDNPFADLRLDRLAITDAKPITPLSTADEQCFWETCDPWAAHLFAVLAYTGMRPGEVSGLMLDDLDFEAKVIWVRNKPEFFIFTKTRCVRRVPMTAEIETALKASITQRHAGPVFLRRPYATGGLQPLLVGLTRAELVSKFSAEMSAERAHVVQLGQSWNRELQHRAAQRAWKNMGGIRAREIRREYIRIMRKAGLPQRTCVKDLRHSWATTLQAARVDPFARKEMLGHKGLLQTETYTHTSVAVLLEEAQRARAVRASAVDALQTALRL